MKVFFTASQRGQKFYEEIYREIFDKIKRLGHTHLYDKLIKIPYKKFYETLEKEGHKASVELYRENIEKLSRADINIFECSLHSLSIGFLVQKSLEFRKPTVVLYLKENLPYFLSGVKDDKLLMKSYDKTSLREVLKGALEEVTALRDQRFNFFISDALLRYLDEASKKAGVNKSTFLRNLLLKHKRSNHR